MSRLDRRFALLRGSQAWYAVFIEDRETRRVAYRVSGNGTRDARKQAEQLTDLAEAAARVIKDGMRIRCAPHEASAPSSLYLRSDGVTGYKLDPAIAKSIGVPPAVLLT